MSEREFNRRSRCIRSRWRSAEVRHWSHRTASSFRCPDTINEQQAIAAALSDADGVVAGLERVIAKKRLIKQGAMQDLLTARRRLPGFSGEWEVKRLGSVAEHAGRLP